MNAAVWLIHYRITEADRDAYVSWFHDVHIPEKLARPGYTWANHYVAPPDPDTNSREYVAMFGGTQTRVFLDPSPAQIRPRQDALTREMMQLRQQGSGVIYAHEWSDGMGDATHLMPVQAPRLRTHFITADAADEAAGAYAVQTMTPALLNHSTTLRVSKLVAVTAGVRHVMLEQLAKPDAAPADVPQMPEGVTSTTFTGTRLWPAA